MHCQYLLSFPIKTPRQVILLLIRRWTRLLSSWHIMGRRQLTVWAPHVSCIFVSEINSCVFIHVRTQNNVWMRMSSPVIIRDLRCPIADPYQVRPLRERWPSIITVRKGRESVKSAKQWHKQVPMRGREGLNFIFLLVLIIFFASQDLQKHVLTWSTCVGCGLDAGPLTSN